MPEGDPEPPLEPDAEACSLSAPLERLGGHLAKLTQLIHSGELESSLRRLMLMNAVRHGDRAVSAHEADVVERVAGLARPVPLARLTAREVACLQRLERPGFVVVEQRVVRATPRGRALAAARAHERGVSKVVLGRVRDTLAKISA